ncbi:MAG: adenylate/guanylate cyclase domain-containing protein [bacterium]
MIAIAYLGYHSGEVNLTTRIFNQLTSVRASKVYQIQAYFESLRDQTQALSEDLMVVNAMKAFKSSYRELEGKKIPEPWLTSIDGYYQESYLPRLAQLNEGQPIANLYEPNTAPSQYLQYHYIANNSNPVGSKQKLNDPGDGSSYSAYHSKYHPVLEKYHDRFGYYDLFLIDPENGAIVYSIFKEVDYATSLKTGPYRNSNLAAAVDAAIEAKGKGYVKIVDFDHYKPSYGAPAAFIAAPIFDGDEFVGVLALQFPVDDINRVMTGNKNWVKDGLGQSGETYLVGSDHKMRSVSRFLVEDPKGYVELLKSLNVDDETIEDIKRYGTSIIEQEVNTEATNEALARREGTKIVDDYRGIKVLSSYSPLSVKGLDWAVLSEMDLDEAYAPVNEFKRIILVWGSLIIMLITAASLLLSSVFIRPVKRLISSTKDIGKGELNNLAALETTGEFGELARALNGMVDGLQAQTRLVEKESKDRQNLVLNMLPATVANRLLKGEESIADQVENVSILFTDVIGFSELARSMSAAQMVRSLNDLVRRFDSVTDQYGIEKIKTSGDNYIAACGLSVTRLDHMSRMVDFALELQSQIKRFNYDHGCDLDVVSSIHAGDVIAGIVGRKKVIYDVWGETVTVANRILAQSSGTRGTILVSEPVHEFLRDLYGFEKVEPRTPSERLIPVWRLTTASKLQPDNA